MKTLLITGDDGYKSLGARLLSKIFKDEYAVTVVATMEQKSGAGGSTKAFGSKAWGMETVDGVDSYWVDGTPADSMEFAQGKFPQGFDYIISGINWGENIGLCALTSSGTGGAAIRALALGLAPKIVIMSWMQANQDIINWSRNTSSENIDDYITYPGNAAKYIFHEIIKNDFFGKKLVNVNFPYNETTQYQITTFLGDIKQYYRYPVIITDNSYSYEEQVYDFSETIKQDKAIDAGALIAGIISVTPFNIG